MLRGCWGDVVLDADGMHSCFIDADPGTFTHILTYLRTGRMPLFWLPTGGFDLSLYSRVLDQAHFFCIEPLRTWIEKRNYEKAVTLTDFVELRDDDEAKNWKGDLKNISQRYGNSKVDVHHEWAKEKKYLCPRGIPVHYGKPEACGRACEQAKGDDPDEYHTWDYCRFVIETQTTEFNHKALEPEVEPGIEPEDWLLMPKSQDRAGHVGRTSSEDDQGEVRRDCMITVMKP